MAVIFQTAIWIFFFFFFNENIWISINVLLKFVPRGPINNIPALVQIMAWRRSGDKPLSEPMMVTFLTYMCLTRPQWVIPHHNIAWYLLLLTMIQFSAFHYFTSTLKWNGRTNLKPQLYVTNSATWGNWKHSDWWYLHFSNRASVNHWHKDVKGRYDGFSL